MSFFKRPSLAPPQLSTWTNHLSHLLAKCCGAGLASHGFSLMLHDTTAVLLWKENTSYILWLPVSLLSFVQKSYSFCMFFGGRTQQTSILSGPAWIGRPLVLGSPWPQTNHLDSTAQTYAHSNMTLCNVHPLLITPPLVRHFTDRIFPLYYSQYKTSFPPLIIFFLENPPQLVRHFVVFFKDKF